MFRSKYSFRTFLVAGIAALTLGLYACGGGSISGSGGSSSGSTIAGTVTDGGSASVWTSPNESRGLALVVVDVLISTAYADGIPGLTVELVDSGGVVVATTTTDANGDFEFSGLAAGDYSIVIKDAGGTVLGQSPLISVNANTQTKVEIASNGVVLEIESEDGTSIKGGVDEDSDSASSDDLSSDGDSVSGDGDSVSGDGDSGSATIAAALSRVTF